MVTASHRSAIALRKATESVRGKARVCGSAPAPGATPARRMVTHWRWPAEGALGPGDADFAEGDPVPATLAVAVGAGD